MGLFVVLLFLMPLAVVFGLRKARRAEVRLAGGGSRLSRALRMLVMPAIVAVTAGMAAVEYGWLGGARSFAASIGLEAGTNASHFYTGNGLADALIWVALSFGNLMVILFFASVPYVMGSLMAAGLVLSGRVPKSLPAEHAGDDETPGARPL